MKRCKNPNCNKLFKPYDIRQEYCCPKCKIEDYFRSKQEQNISNKQYKKCECCGEDYIPFRSSQKFCSKKCAEKFYRHNKTKPIKKKCEYCGKEFYTYNEEKYYCSKECKRKDFELVFPPKKLKSKSHLLEKNNEAVKQNKSYGEYIAEKDNTIPTAEEIINSFNLYLKRKNNEKS